MVPAAFGSDRYREEMMGEEVRGPCDTRCDCQSQFSPCGLVNLQNDARLGGPLTAPYQSPRLRTTETTKAHGTEGLERESGFQSL